MRCQLCVSVPGRVWWKKPRVADAGVQNRPRYWATPTKVMMIGLRGQVALFVTTRPGAVVVCPLAVRRTLRSHVNLASWYHPVDSGRRRLGDGRDANLPCWPADAARDVPGPPSPRPFELHSMLEIGIK